MVILKPMVATKLNNVMVLFCRRGTTSRGIGSANLASSSSSSFGLVGPAAKLLFFHYNIEPAQIQKPSGPKHNILKRFESFLSSIL
jgi:hypothetical protein